MQVPHSKPRRWTHLQVPHPEPKRWVDWSFCCTTSSSLGTKRWTHLQVPHPELDGGLIGPLFLLYHNKVFKESWYYIVSFVLFPYLGNFFHRQMGFFFFLFIFYFLGILVGFLRGKWGFDCLGKQTQEGSKNLGLRWWIHYMVVFIPWLIGLFSSTTWMILYCKEKFHSIERTDWQRLNTQEQIKYSRGCLMRQCKIILHW